MGISGPRGSGKTTLLRTFHEGRRRINGRAPGLAALVSAPVEYEPRDFVLHLFEQVCRAAGSDNRAGPATAHEPSFLRPRVNLATALGVVGAISLVAGTALLLTEAHFGDLDSKEQLALAVGALVAGLAVIPRRIHVVAGAALATPIVVIYVHDWQAAALLVAGVAWLALLAANVLAWRIMRLVVVLALVAGIVLGIGGLAGLDVGDRAATGAIVLVVAAMAVTALDREAGALAARGPVWPIAATASFAATFVGLVLMLFDAPPSTEVIVGFALTGCGLAWIAAAVGRPSLAVPTAVLPDPIPFAALRDAYFRKMAVPIEMFEQRLAEALITPESRSAAADVIARLRSWRIGGGQLDDAGLEDALIEARDRMPVGGEWMEIARFELRRRRTRHEAWRRDADAWMQRIRYQQSFSSTWSGKAGVTRPLTLEATRGRGLSVAEVPMTLPQIVIGLQEYLRNASDVEPVVIAIDELDKMGSVEAAERFLNEVKAIFGVSNCYFLISVSEDAVANFERRGLPFRDVVDSSFDEVRRLSYLTLADSESLLAKRVVFLPYPFAALCHALSGGLARDLIRTTRALFDVRRTTGKTDMASLCRALVTAELTAKRDGIVTAVRGLSDRLDVSSVLRTLGSVPVEDLSLKGLEDELRLPFDAQGDHESGQLAALALAALVREFVGFRYLCVTLVEIFAHKVDFEVLRQMVQGLPTLHDFDELARARQGFTVDPVLAWQRISAVREAWELKVLPAPTLATVGQGVPVEANGGQS